MRRVIGSLGQEPNDEFTLLSMKTEATNHILNPLSLTSAQGRQRGKDTLADTRASTLYRMGIIDKVLIQAGGQRKHYVGGAEFLIHPNIVSMCRKETV